MPGKKFSPPLSRFCTLSVPIPIPIPIPSYNNGFFPVCFYHCLLRADYPNVTNTRCDGCADTVKKPKLDQHRGRCHASFTCLGTLAVRAWCFPSARDRSLISDCSTTFRNGEYKCVFYLQGADFERGANEQEPYELC